MASRREYEMLFQLNAQLGGGFAGTFNKAQQQILSMQKEIQALSKTQGDITSYQKQQGAVEGTQKKLEVLQQQYDNIQREIQETGGFSSDLENKLLSKQQQIDRTAAALEKETNKLNEMGAALQNAGIDTSNLDRESERLTAEMRDLRKQQDEAAAGAENFGTSSAEAFETAANALTAAGLVAGMKKIYDAYAECVGIAGEFQESMSNVEALSGASAYELAQLTDMAKELGATTKFTAKESADAMGYMAMAGWSAEQMLSGMPGVLSLAAASGEDLARVSDIVTDSMTAFGLTAADTARYADVLAATAANANTSVGVMGETFKYAAPVAGALGYSIEDVSTSIGLMANAGIKGSNAGTALRNVFNGLLEGVTLTGAAFGEAEVSAVRADGTMASLGETVEMLRRYFDQMTEAERVSNASAIAGQRGYAGLLAILSATDADYAKLAESINNSAGAAQRMADVKMDNMRGQLTLLNSAWDAVKTTIGEQYTPTLQKAYGVGADVLSQINSYLQANPSVIKGVTVLAGGLGAVATGIVGISAAGKLLKALNLGGLLVGAAGLTPLGTIAAITAGVTGLAAALVTLYSDTGEGVLHLRELTEAAREMESTVQKTGAAFSDTSDRTDAAAAVADHYISRLEEMGSYEALSAEQQKEYRNILSLLCETVPELSGLIDTQTGSIMGGTAALRENTRAWRENAISQAYDEQLQELRKAYAAASIEVAQNEIKRTRATDELTDAQKRFNAAQERMTQLSAEAAAAAEEETRATGAYVDPLSKLTEEYLELEAQMPQLHDDLGVAQRNLDTVNAAIDEGNLVLRDAEAAMALAEEAMDGLTGALGRQADAWWLASDEGKELREVLGDTITDIQALTELYNAAYDAAYTSVSGQYSLWEEAEAVVATSAGSINKALETQIQHWNEYNENLASLRERAGDIEGLSEIIASFADGSNDSVAAIAGLASASDEDLKAMVGNWQELQKAQTETSDAIAEFKTGFSRQMDELTEELAEKVKAMDLSAEAGASGAAMIQAFIDSAEDKTRDVREAYARLGLAAANAMKVVPGQYLPANMPRLSHGTIDTHGWISGAYASGTDNAPAGLALVGERGPEYVVFGGGEKVLTAEETKELRQELVLLQRELSESDLKETQIIGSFRGAELYVETLRTMGSIPAYAVGTEKAAPGLALVGEKGPELVMMQGGEKVLTAEETKEYLREAALLRTIIPGYAQGTGSTDTGLAAVGGMSAQEARCLEEETVLLRMIVPELMAISAYVRGLTFVAPGPAAGDEGQSAALQPMTAVWNARPAEAEAAIYDPPGNRGSGGTEYHIQFSPAYNISGNAAPAEVEAVLREHDNSLREQLEELLSDIEADRTRSAYR